MNPFQVLLAEDNPGDVRLTQEAFKESNIPVELHVVSNGVETLRFLAREGVYRGSPVPDLILLDLNMPKLDGREALVAIKQDARLKNIPVVVLTTSHYHEDVTFAYTHHANCYINKPIDFEIFIDILSKVSTFWFDIASLPPSPAVYS